MNRDVIISLVAKIMFVAAAIIYAVTNFLAITVESGQIPWFNQMSGTMVILSAMLSFGVFCITIIIRKWLTAVYSLVAAAGLFWEALSIFEGFFEKKLFSRTPLYLVGLIWLAIAVVCLAWDFVVSRTGSGSSDTFSDTVSGDRKKGRRVSNEPETGNE